MDCAAETDLADMSSLEGPVPSAVGRLRRHGKVRAPETDARSEIESQDPRKLAIEARSYTDFSEL